jgi:hypothetical protein
MIGGIVGLLALIWVYQTVTKANVTNGVVWVMVCVAAYLASQFIMIGAANYIIESMRADQGEGYERDLMSGFQGSKGMLSSVFFELFPPIAGFMLVAFIRTKIILKESISKSNLFSGLGDMFISIKDSFKNPDQK